MSMITHRRIALPLSALLATAIIASSAAFPTTARSQETERATYCPSFGQSVAGVLLSAPATKVFAGASLPIEMSVVNLADRPLAGSAVMVKLFGESGQAFARYVVLRDLALPAGGAKRGSFLIQIPEGLPTGEYILEATYVLSTEFSPENPDLTGYQRSRANSYALSMTVEGSGSPIVRFDPESVKVAEAGADEPISASVDLTNAAASSAAVPVLWKIYRWNGVSDSALVDSKAELVTVPANGKKAASVAINDKGHAYYTVIAEADYHGLRPILAFQAGRDKGESLISALGISALPKDAAGNIDVYACIDNVFSDDDEVRRISVEVADLDTGRALYRGVSEIPQGSSFEFVRAFDPKGSQSIKVLAVVSDASGAQVSAYERVFDCKALGGCEAGGAQEKEQWWLYPAQVLACLVGAALAYLWLKSRKIRRGKKR